MERPSLASRILDAASDWMTQGDIQEAVQCSRKDTARLIKHLVSGHLMEVIDLGASKKRLMYRATTK